MKELRRGELASAEPILVAKAGVPIAWLTAQLLAAVIGCLIFLNTLPTSLRPLVAPATVSLFLVALCSLALSLTLFLV